MPASHTGHERHHHVFDKLHHAEEVLRQFAKTQTRQLGVSSQLAAQQLQTKMRNTPDWARRSIRLSLCLVFFGVLGHSKLISNTTLASEFRQSCNWAAITCVVVTAPLIGQVAEVSLFRSLGTMMGGFLGFVVWSLGNLATGGFWAGLIVVFCSPLLVTPTTYLAYKHSADQLTKFVQLTYVIVGFNSKPDKGAAVLASLRVAGIIAGGLVSLVFAVLILPRSATVESCRELKKALRCMEQLNKAVWAASTTPLPAPEAKLTHKRKHSALDLLGLRTAAGTIANSRVATSSGSALHSMGNIQGLLGQHGPAVTHQPVEKLFTAVYASLGRVETMLAQCKGEVFIHPWGGRYFFLPSWIPPKLYGVNFKQPGGWHLPHEQMSHIITILHRITRLLWTLLLDFEDGLDASMQEVLHQYYPKALMSELALYTHLSIQDLANAFPNRSVIEIDNLLNLGQVVDCLLTISDARNRSTMKHVRRRREPRHADNPPSGAGTRRLASNASTLPATAPSGALALNLGQTTPTSPPLGAFASRTLAPGEVSLLELPPRRLLRSTTTVGVSTTVANPAYGLHVNTGRVSMEGTKLPSVAMEGVGGKEQKISHQHSHQTTTITAFPNPLSTDKQAQSMQQLAQNEVQKPIPRVATRSAFEDLSNTAILELQPLLAAPQDAGYRSTPQEVGGLQRAGTAAGLEERPLLAQPSSPMPSEPAATSQKLRDQPMLSNGERSPQAAVKSRDAISNQQRRAENADLSTKSFAFKNSTQSSNLSQTSMQYPQKSYDTLSPTSVDAMVYSPKGRRSGLEETYGMCRSPRTPRVSNNDNTDNTAFQGQDALKRQEDVFLQPHLQAMADRSSAHANPGMAPHRLHSMLASRLDSLVSYSAVEPVQFPPTEEGFVSQVRWHSLQWLLDELVEELEEAFLAVSVVMSSLPHPIS